MVKFNLYKEGSYKTDSEVKARFLAPIDFKYIETKENSFWKLLGEIMAGSKCVGLINNGTVVSYLWVNDKFIQYYGLKLALKSNEVYIYSAITKPDERGKGYAEILRAKTYELFREQGKYVFYSITDLKNKPAMRLKEKIGAEIVGSYKYYKLFRKLVKL